jgi:hypothetical protein
MPGRHPTRPGSQQRHLLGASPAAAEAHANAPASPAPHPRARRRFQLQTGSLRPGGYWVQVYYSGLLLQCLEAAHYSEQVRPLTGQAPQATGRCTPPDVMHWPAYPLVNLGEDELGRMVQFAVRVAPPLPPQPPPGPPQPPPRAPLRPQAPGGQPPAPAQPPPSKAAEAAKAAASAPAITPAVAAGMAVAGAVVVVVVGLVGKASRRRQLRPAATVAHPPRPAPAAGSADAGPERAGPPAAAHRCWPTTSRGTSQRSATAPARQSPAQAAAGRGAAGGWGAAAWPPPPPRRAMRRLAGGPPWQARWTCCRRARACRGPMPWRRRPRGPRLARRPGRRWSTAGAAGRRAQHPAAGRLLLLVPAGLPGPAWLAPTARSPWRRRCSPAPATQAMPQAAQATQATAPTAHTAPTASTAATAATMATLATPRTSADTDRPQVLCVLESL